MYEVLAKHKEKDEIFAIDGKERKFMFKTNDIRTKAYIKNQYYDKLQTDNKLDLASKSDSDHLQNGGVVTFEDNSQSKYPVSHYLFEVSKIILEQYPIGYCSNVILQTLNRLSPFPHNVILLAF